MRETGNAPGRNRPADAQKMQILSALINPERGLNWSCSMHTIDYCQNLVRNFKDTSGGASLNTSLNTSRNNTINGGTVFITHLT